LLDQDRFIGSILESKWRGVSRARSLGRECGVSDPAYSLLYLQHMEFTMLRISSCTCMSTTTPGLSADRGEGIFSSTRKASSHTPIERAGRIGSPAHQAQFARRLPRASLERTRLGWNLRSLVRWMKRRPGSAGASLGAAYGGSRAIRRERDGELTVTRTLETNHLRSSASGRYQEQLGMLYKRGTR
jgi:hypothetical protein